LRKPLFQIRNQLIAKIPNFWINTFENHPKISQLIHEDEEECLHFLSKLEVEVLEDIKSDFKIKFYFENNPFFENDLLEKEFHTRGLTPILKLFSFNLMNGSNDSSNDRSVDTLFLEFNRFLIQK
jgi:hypothetical protein